MKIYPPTYEPGIEEKHIVSAAKKTAAINKVKAHMTKNRGYLLKELIDVAQAELHKSGPHVRDDEVAVWIKDLDADWGWHPATVEPDEILKAPENMEAR